MTCYLVPQVTPLEICTMMIWDKWKSEAHVLVVLMQIKDSQWLMLTLFCATFALI